MRYEGSHRAEPGGGHADRDWCVLFRLATGDSEDGQTDSWQTVGDMPSTENVTCTDEHVLHHLVIQSVQFALESNSVSTVDDPHDTAHWKWFVSPVAMLAPELYRSKVVTRTSVALCSSGLRAQMFIVAVSPRVTW